VTDSSSSAGVEEITVLLSDAEDDELLSIALTDENGDFTFAGLSEGTYSVRPTSEAFIFAPTTLQSSPGSSELTFLATRQNLGAEGCEESSQATTLFEIFDIADDIRTRADELVELFTDAADVLPDRKQARFLNQLARQEAKTQASATLVLDRIETVPAVTLQCPRSAGCKRNRLVRRNSLLSGRVSRLYSSAARIVSVGTDTLKRNSPVVRRDERNALQVMRRQALQKVRNLAKTTFTCDQ
jgi:hypothetical protein